MVTKFLVKWQDHAEGAWHEIGLFKTLSQAENWISIMKRENPAAAHAFRIKEIER